MFYMPAFAALSCPILQLSLRSEISAALAPSVDGDTLEPGTRHQIEEGCFLELMSPSEVPLYSYLPHATSV